MFALVPCLPSAGHQLAGTVRRQPTHSRQPARNVRASSGGGAAHDDAGATFVERFRSIAADAVQPADASGSNSSGSCCGGSTTEPGAPEQAAGSCCGGGGAGAEVAAAAVSSQLSSMMGGMEGQLTREDLREAFLAGRPSGSSASSGGGERFVDVAAVLRGEGGAADEDADLDALVV